MTHSLIVGFGSPCGDDRFGWLVIGRLQELIANDNRVKLTCCDRSGVDWIHQYQPVDRLIFIDAVKSDTEAGTLHHLTFTPSSFNTLPISHSSHGIDLKQGLAIAAEIIDLPDEIEFYGAELDNCNPNTPVSQTIQKQSVAIAAQLLQSINIRDSKS